MNNVLKPIWGRGLLSICLALVLALLTASNLYAQPPDRPGLNQPPDRPDMPQDPPPRPEMSSLAVTAEQQGGIGGSLGRIQLQTYPGAWTVVQWQDGSGNWNDVEGWRIQTASGTVTWTVEEQHLGTGPFRWISYGPNGRINAASYSFNLPKAGKTVNVSLSGGWNGGYTEYQYPNDSRGRQQPYGGQSQQWDGSGQRQPQQPYYNQQQQRQRHPRGQCRHCRRHW